MEEVVIEEETATDTSKKKEDPTTIPCCLLELPLREAAATFNLEKAVCSHGLFMMAPNYWDPLSKTQSRSLRLSLHDSDGDGDADGVMGQLVRMLRLSESDERNVREFRKIVPTSIQQVEGEGEGEWEGV